jgi:hypothetical protein
VTLQAWGTAAVIAASSLLLGHGLGLIGVRSRTAGPAVGLALLIIVSSIAVRLPGTAVTSAVILALLLIVEAVEAVRHRGAWRLPAVPVAVACIAGFGAAIPFLSTGRVGLPGVALDNDMASHLEYAQALRSAASRAIYGLPTAYPLGPHSLVATVASGLGVRLDLAFTGLLIATVIITALTGANALRGEAGYKRVIIGVLAALLYLVAAYYGEAAFKEQLMGLFVLATVLHLEEVRAGPPLRSWRLLRALIPVSLIWAAGIYVYGYLALAWLAGTVVIWLVGEVVFAPRRLLRWRAQLRDLLPGAAGAVFVLLIVLAPNAGRVLNLFSTFGTSPSGAITTSMRGNLVSALSPFEALGIWHSIDFRFAPVDPLHSGVLSGLALGALILGLLWSLARRELVLPAAIAACALIWWRSSRDESIYVTAKALVIAGPVVAVTSLRGLLRSPPRPVGWPLWLPRLAVAVVFVLVAVRSSYDALANEPVWPSESTHELLALDKVTGGHTVLFLGASDFTEWLFAESRMSALAPNSTSLGHAGPRATEPIVYGAALDFDSVNPLDLNRFSYVITTNTSYASQPPAAFRLVRSLPMYQLWKRVGAVTSRQTIEPSGAPGAVLNCHTRAGRAISRQRGAAAVLAPPVVAGGSGIGPGATADLSIPLPAGRWELSFQYTSAADLSVTAGGARWTMPAYQDRPGPVFRVGTVTSSGGPVPVTVHNDRPSSLTGADQGASVTAMVATRIPDTRTLVPLSRSCGRYIDWFRTVVPAAK